MPMRPCQGFGLYVINSMYAVVKVTVKIEFLKIFFFKKKILSY